MMAGSMPAVGNGAWWMGSLVHFINGTIIFPLIYYSLYGLLPWRSVGQGRSARRDPVGGGAGIVMPITGMGFFSAKAPQPMLAVMGRLIGPLIYGMIFGSMAGRAPAETAGSARAQRPVKRRHDEATVGRSILASGDRLPQLPFDTVAHGCLTLPDAFRDGWGVFLAYRGTGDPTACSSWLPSREPRTSCERKRSGWSRRPSTRSRKPARR